MKYNHINKFHVSSLMVCINYISVCYLCASLSTTLSQLLPPLFLCVDEQKSNIYISLLFSTLSNIFSLTKNDCSML